MIPSEPKGGCRQVQSTLAPRRCRERLPTCRKVGLTGVAVPSFSHGCPIDHFPAAAGRLSATSNGTRRDGVAGSARQRHAKSVGSTGFRRLEHGSLQPPSGNVANGLQSRVCPRWAENGRPAMPSNTQSGRPAACRRKWRPGILLQREKMSCISDVISTRQRRLLSRSAKTSASLAGTWDLRPEGRTVLQ